jgi:hypothetical protein
MWTCVTNQKDTASLIISYAAGSHKENGTHFLCITLVKWQTDNLKHVKERNKRMTYPLPWHYYHPIIAPVSPHSVMFFQVNPQMVRIL